MCLARLGRHPVGMHTLSLSVWKLGIWDIYWMILLILKHVAVSIILATYIQQGQTVSCSLLKLWQGPTWSQCLPQLEISGWLSLFFDEFCSLFFFFFWVAFALFPLAQFHIRCNGDKCHGLGNSWEDSMTKTAWQTREGAKKGGKQLCRGEVSDRKDWQGRWTMSCGLVTAVYSVNFPQFSCIMCCHCAFLWQFLFYETQVSHFLNRTIPNID